MKAEWWLKRARLFSKLMFYRTIGYDKPIVSLLFLTSRCNLNCNYCFADHQGETPDLSVVQWKKVISELKDNGADTIILMGGEPLLYNEVDAIIDYVKELGMQCHLTTNGLHVPKHIPKLQKLDQLMVSLDGDKTGNDLNRGAGSWEKATQAITLANAYDIPVRINAVLTRHTLHDVDWLIDYASAHKSYVGFTIPARFPNQENNAFNKHLLNDTEILMIHKQLLEYKKAGKPITLSQESLKHVINYPKTYHELIYYTDAGSEAYQQCAYGRRVVFVDATGNIYPCTTLWELPEFKPKNVFRDGMKEALHNAQNLNCKICYCAGGVEWNHISSIHGIFDAFRFSMVGE